jgi:hypothetical protein
MRRHLLLSCALIVSVLPLLSSRGQTFAPVTIQAVSPAPPVLPKPNVTAPETGSTSTVQLLQEMQATNAATIKKQEAALATLDELRKAAEELKIFSKRS